MSETKQYVSQLLSDLKQQRDELRLQIHLGGKELKEQWNALEDKLLDLDRRCEPIKEAVGDTAEDVWESLKLLGGEVKEGFQRIRKSLG
jgi:hypothetical protein